MEAEQPPGPAHIQRGNVASCHAKVAPKYLISNSTSHGAFSAIAELIDNAYDSGSSTMLSIDACTIGSRQLQGSAQTMGHLCLEFHDNGSGMTPENLFQMLSFGFSEKTGQSVDSDVVGQYGNGFKSGSMRLGSDALVLTRHRGTMSAGFLSHTMNKNLNTDSVIVPIVSYTESDPQCRLLPSPDNESQPNIMEDLILQHSIFNDKSALVRAMLRVGAFSGQSNCKSGTRILIWNLKGLEDESGAIQTELDFNDDANNIIYRPYMDDVNCRWSLRHYISILYYKPPCMKILLRNKKVALRSWKRTLIKSVDRQYQPQVQYTRTSSTNGPSTSQQMLCQPVEIVIGVNSNKKQHGDPLKHYGLMLYHKNRLITFYDPIGYQNTRGAREARGIGVVCVARVFHLNPNQSKTHFLAGCGDNTYARLKNALASRLNDYVEDVLGETDPTQVINDGDMALSWVRCDKCFKWRILPADTNIDEDKDWFCSYLYTNTEHPCDVPSEDPNQQPIVPSTPRPKKTGSKTKMREAEAQLREKIQEQEKELQAAAVERQKLAVQRKLEQQEKRNVASVLRKKKKAFFTEMDPQIQRMMDEALPFPSTAGPSTSAVHAQEGGPPSKQQRVSESGGTRTVVVDLTETDEDDDANVDLSQLVNRQMDDLQRTCHTVLSSFIVKQEPIDSKPDCTPVSVNEVESSGMQLSPAGCGVSEDEHSMALARIRNLECELQEREEKLAAQAAQLSERNYELQALRLRDEELQNAARQVHGMKRELAERSEERSELMRSIAAQNSRSRQKQYRLAYLTNRLVACVKVESAFHDMPAQPPGPVPEEPQLDDYTNMVERRVGEAIRLTDNTITLD